MTTALPEPAPTFEVDWCSHPLTAWLLTEGWKLNDPREILAQFARQMVAAGLPLWRLVCVIRTLDPQIMGTRYMWRRDLDASKVRYKAYPLPHEAIRTFGYADSPLAAILNGEVPEIRRRLDAPSAEPDYLVLDELYGEGATDYVAMPLVFSDGQINAITFASDRSGGFSVGDMEELYRMRKVLGLLLEAPAMRRKAKGLLDTYLGKHTGERVLKGLIKRGDGENIHAVIWFCDLRDSTQLAENLSPEDFIKLLNEFFECTAGPVLARGGEILRFIGDAALAIFPTGVSSSGIDRGCCSREAACHAALAAARDAHACMEALNRGREQRGEPALGYGLALHMGDVMYGNIGVPERLEFTVVGAAANKAARLEGLCRSLNRPLLISSEFRRCFSGELVSLGRHPLRGVSALQEVFTLQ